MSVVVTELRTGRPVTLGRGDLPRNVLASAAIPGVFPAVEVDGTAYVDEGIAAWVPIEEVVRTIVVFDAVPADLTVLYLPSHCSGPGRWSEFEASPADFGKIPPYIREARKGTEQFLESVRVDGPGVYGDAGSWAGVPG